ncbi:MAG: hypothetical protein P1U87_01945 [Verrucomicrobiales bacterium]|nr:hypothetical protein [Verrucomicrobiales bacterium]
MSKSPTPRRVHAIYFVGAVFALLFPGIQNTAEGGAFYLTVRGKINNNKVRQNIGGTYRGIRTGRYSSYDGYRRGTPTDEKVFVSGALTSVPGTRLAESNITGYYPAWVNLRVEGTDYDNISERKRTYVRVQRRFIIVGTFRGRLRMNKPFKVNERGRQRFRGRGVLLFDD